MSVETFEIDRTRPATLAPKTSRNGLIAGNESPRKPGAGFRGHGTGRFTSSIRLAPDTRRSLEAIRSELLEVHAPATIEEADLVERLAIAKVDLIRARTAWEDRLQWQKSHARELFDRSRRHRFEIDAKAWNESPHGMSMIFGQCWHSARFLADLWHGVLTGLDTPFGLHFDQVKNMIQSLGGDWRVDRLDAVRGPVMCWFLAIVPNAETLLRQWICASRARRSGLASPELDQLRAEAFLAAAPSAEVAKENLRRLAETQHAIWSAELENQRKAYFEERDRCDLAMSAEPLGDPADMNETRRIRRELTKAESQFEKLERRLMSQRKARQRIAIPGSHESLVAGVPAMRIEPDRDSSRPAANSRGNAGTATQEGGTERLRACRVDSLVTTPSRDVANVSTVPRTESGSADEQVRPRPARRADPARLAKSWRAKRAKPAKGHSGVAAFEPSTRTISEEPRCED